MKKLIIIALITTIVSCSSYKKDEFGVSFQVKSPTDHGVKTLRADVIDEDIIHIQSGPDLNIPKKNSLIVDPHLIKRKVNWDMLEDKDDLILQTSKLQVRIDKLTGKVTFCDKNGNILLAESRQPGASFTPYTLEGKKSYKIREVFDSPEDEALYGLGQHQNGEVNYKGKDVDLLQQNIIAVVPFLVSNKNYGILWDNYSRTKFGDPREYNQLSMFRQFNESGEPGGLTAKYYADRGKQNLIAQRIEDTVYFKYLDQQKSFPQGFVPKKGLVEWTGFIEADSSGKYKFLVYSAGYLKVWMDNKLISDSWRQCWNPCSRKYTVELHAGERVPIRLEWIPDGVESYISLECLTPYNEELQQKISWSSEAGSAIDYYFIKGENPDDVVAGYRQVTGKSPIMPVWAMGLWQSRERYKTQNELLGVVKEYRRRKIPLDNIVLDWHYWKENKWGNHSFDYKRFPDPVGMINELHNQYNAHIMISVWPKFYENTENYKIMKEHGYLYMENIKNRQRDWVGPGYVSTFYDAFNPGARAEYWRQINDSLYAKGIDAWWLDATEPDILSNSSLESRKKLMSPSIGTSTEYMNAYSLVQAEGVYGGQRSVNPDSRVFILTRSAFAGQQKYAAATWSGDIVSRWSDLKEQVAAGVNISIAGIPYWTTDIGGFALEARYEYPDSENLQEWRELNLRWFQFGAFCPLFRIHGQFPYREIYNISPEGHPVYKSMVYYDKLRYRLMPYIYSMAGMTYHNDFTIMRPLVMDYGSDQKVLSVNDEFMFGKALLVCPVTTYKATGRDIYLPAGCGWYDLLNGTYYQGGNTYHVPAPLEKIPVFVPEGTILPVGPEIQFTDEKLADPIDLFIFAGADGSFSFYEDEGTNYNYEKGSFSFIRMSYSTKENKLTIGKREGQFPGMLKERIFRVKLIAHGTGLGIDNDTLAKEVNYTGEEIVVQL
jgi:alpha-D-xyloside xylohydrolase